MVGHPREYPTVDDARRPTPHEEDADSAAGVTEERCTARSSTARRAGVALGCATSASRWLESHDGAELGARDDARGCRRCACAVGRGSVTVINAVAVPRSRAVRRRSWPAVRRRDRVAPRRRGALPLRGRLSVAARARSGATARRWSCSALAAARAGAVARRGALRSAGGRRRAARRSLAEQIRGTGQFALRHGGGEALHAAACARSTKPPRGASPAMRALPPTERAARARATDRLRSRRRSPRRIHAAARARPTELPPRGRASRSGAAPDSHRGTRRVEHGTQ